MSASFSLFEQSRARSEGIVNIQMDHMPINRHMSGSFEGNTRLKERTPPRSIDAYPWISKTEYNVLPGTAGFLEAVEALGAKVAAALLTTFFRSFSIAGAAVEVEVEAEEPLISFSISSKLLICKFCSCCCSSTDVGVSRLSKLPWILKLPFNGGKLKEVEVLYENE